MKFGIYLTGGLWILSLIADMNKSNDHSMKKPISVFKLTVIKKM